MENIFSVFLWIANFLFSIIETTVSILHSFGRVIVFIFQLVTVLPDWVVLIPSIFIACTIVWAILKN